MRLSFFGYYFESYFCGDILVEFHGSFVSAYFLNVLEHDALAVNFDVALSEFFGDVEVRYRTIDGTGSAHFGCDLNTLNGVDLLGQCDGVVLDLFELVCLLLECFSQFLLAEADARTALPVGMRKLRP